MKKFDLFIGFFGNGATVYNKAVHLFRMVQAGGQTRKRNN